MPKLDVKAHTASGSPSEPEAYSCHSVRQCERLLEKFWWVQAEMCNHLQKAIGNETSEARHRRNTPKHWRKTAAKFTKSTEVFAESAALSAEILRGLHHAISATRSLGSMARMKPLPNGMRRTENTREGCPTAASPYHHARDTHVAMAPENAEIF